MDSAEQPELPARGESDQLFEEASSCTWVSSMDELTHDDMVNLANLFTGWAMGHRTEPRWSAKLLGWAESFENLSVMVGPDWDPPEPKRLSIIGLIARQVRPTGS
jgi:hypothetical protein